jgi:hypothetical protein
MKNQLWITAISAVICIWCFGGVFSGLDKYLTTLISLLATVEFAYPDFSNVAGLNFVNSATQESDYVILVDNTTLKKGKQSISIPRLISNRTDMVQKFGRSSWIRITIYI